MDAQTDLARMRVHEAIRGFVPQVEHINDEAHLTVDLGLESLSFFRLLVVIETACHFSMPDELIVQNRIRTVHDLIAIVAEHQQEE